MTLSVIEIGTSPGLYVAPYALEIPIKCINNNIESNMLCGLCLQPQMFSIYSTFLSNT